MMTAIHALRRVAEALAALMMAAMFLTFLVQVAIRYSARMVWLAEDFPFLDPSHFGWTLEFCLVLWIWIVFMGNALVVREQDHVIFDILYQHVRPGVRKWFAIIAGLAICIGLIASLIPTWDKFYILRLKKTATLSQIVGDSIRMRDVYAVYFGFLIIVALRYAWRVQEVVRKGPDAPVSHGQGRFDE